MSHVLFQCISKSSVMKRFVLCCFRMWKLIALGSSVCKVYNVTYSVMYYMYSLYDNVS